MGKKAKLGPASDVYGLGALLYYLLTARPPFVAETFEATLAQVLNTDPVGPRQLNPGLPLDLETLCLKCLEKDPARRYQSAQEMADELDRFLKGEPIHARPIGGWQGLALVPAQTLGGGDSADRDRCGSGRVGDRALARGTGPGAGRPGALCRQYQPGRRLHSPGKHRLGVRASPEMPGEVPALGMGSAAVRVLARSQHDPGAYRSAAMADETLD